MEGKERERQAAVPVGTERDRDKGSFRGKTFRQTAAPGLIHALYALSLMFCECFPA